MYTDLHYVAARKREGDSTHVLSMWYIPNGSDYHRATIIEGYFNANDPDEEAIMNQLEKKYSNIPEMASVSKL